MANIADEDVIIIDSSDDDDQRRVSYTIVKPLHRIFTEMCNLRTFVPTNIREINSRVQTMIHDQSKHPTWSNDDQQLVYRNLLCYIYAIKNNIDEWWNNNYISKYTVEMAELMALYINLKCDYILKTVKEVDGMVYEEETNNLMYRLNIIFDEKIDSILMVLMKLNVKQKNAARLFDPIFRHMLSSDMLKHFKKKASLQQYIAAILCFKQWKILSPKEGIKINYEAKKCLPDKMPKSRSKHDDMLMKLSDMISHSVNETDCTGFLMFEKFSNIGNVVKGFHEMFDNENIVSEGHTSPSSSATVDDYCDFDHDYDWQLTSHQFYYDSINAESNEPLASTSGSRLVTTPTREVHAVKVEEESDNSLSYNIIHSINERSVVEEVEGAQFNNNQANVIFSTNIENNSVNINKVVNDINVRNLDVCNDSLSKITNVSQNPSPPAANNIVKDHEKETITRSNKKKKRMGFAIRKSTKKINEEICDPSSDSNDANERDMMKQERERKKRKIKVRKSQKSRPSSDGSISENNTSEDSVGLSSNPESTRCINSSVVSSTTFPDNHMLLHRTGISTISRSCQVSFEVDSTVRCDDKKPTEGPSKFAKDKVQSQPPIGDSTHSHTEQLNANSIPVSVHSNKESLEVMFHKTSTKTASTSVIHDDTENVNVAEIISPIKIVQTREYETQTNVWTESYCKTSNITTPIHCVKVQEEPLKIDSKETSNTHHINQNDNSTRDSNNSTDEIYETRDSNNSSSEICESATLSSFENCENSLKIATTTDATEVKEKDDKFLKLAALVDKESKVTAKSQNDDKLELNNGEALNEIPTVNECQDVETQDFENVDIMKCTDEIEVPDELIIPELCIADVTDVEFQGNHGLNDEMSASDTDHESPAFSKPNSPVKMDLILNKNLPETIKFDATFGENLEPMNIFNKADCHSFKMNNKVIVAKPDAIVQETPEEVVMKLNSGNELEEDARIQCDKEECLIEEIFEKPLLKQEEVNDPISLCTSSLVDEPIEMAIKTIVESQSVDAVAMEVSQESVKRVETESINMNTLLDNTFCCDQSFDCEDNSAMLESSNQNQTKDDNVKSVLIGDQAHEIIKSVEDKSLELCSVNEAEILTFLTTRQHDQPTTMDDQISESDKSQDSIGHISPFHCETTQDTTKTPADNSDFNADLLEISSDGIRTDDSNDIASSPADSRLNMDTEIIDAGREIITREVKSNNKKITLPENLRSAIESAEGVVDESLMKKSFSCDFNPINSTNDKIIKSFNCVVPGDEVSLELNNEVSKYKQAASDRVVPNCNGLDNICVSQDSQFSVEDDVPLIFLVAAVTKTQDNSESGSKMLGAINNSQPIVRIHGDHIKPYNECKDHHLQDSDDQTSGIYSTGAKSIDSSGQSSSESPRDDAKPCNTHQRENQFSPISGNDDPLIDEIYQPGVGDLIVSGDRSYKSGIVKNTVEDYKNETGKFEILNVKVIHKAIVNECNSLSCNEKNPSSVNIIENIDIPRIKNSSRFTVVPVGTDCKAIEGTAEKQKSPLCVESDNKNLRKKSVNAYQNEIVEVDNKFNELHKITKVNENGKVTSNTMSITGNKIDDTQLQNKLVSKHTSKTKSFSIVDILSKGESEEGAIDLTMKRPRSSYEKELNHQTNLINIPSQLVVTQCVTPSLMQGRRSKFKARRTSVLRAEDTLLTTPKTYTPKTAYIETTKDEHYEQQQFLQFFHLQQRENIKESVKLLENSIDKTPLKCIEITAVDKHAEYEQKSPEKKRRGRRKGSKNAKTLSKIKDIPLLPPLRRSHRTSIVNDDVNITFVKDGIAIPNSGYPVHAVASQVSVPQESVIQLDDDITLTSVTEQSVHYLTSPNEAQKCIEASPDLALLAELAEKESKLNVKRSKGRPRKNKTNECERSSIPKRQTRSLNKKTSTTTDITAHAKLRNIAEKYNLKMIENATSVMETAQNIAQETCIEVICKTIPQQCNDHFQTSQIKESDSKSHPESTLTDGSVKSENFAEVGDSTNILISSGGIDKTKGTRSFETSGPAFKKKKLQPANCDYAHTLKIGQSTIKSSFEFESVINGGRSSNDIITKQLIHFKEHETEIVEETLETVYRRTTNNIISNYDNKPYIPLEVEYESDDDMQAIPIGKQNNVDNQNNSNNSYESISEVSVHKSQASIIDVAETHDVLKITNSKTSNATEYEPPIATLESVEKLEQKIEAQKNNDAMPISNSNQVTEQLSKIKDHHELIEISETQAQKNENVIQLKEYDDCVISSIHVVDELFKISDDESQPKKNANESFESEVCIIPALMAVPSKEVQSTKPHESQDFHELCQTTEEGNSQEKIPMESTNESDESVVCVIPILKNHSKENKRNGAEVVANLELGYNPEEESLAIESKNISDESEVCVISALMEIPLKETPIKLSGTIVMDYPELCETSEDEFQSLKSTNKSIKSDVFVIPAIIPLKEIELCKPYETKIVAHDELCTTPVEESQAMDSANDSIESEVCVLPEIIKFPSKEIQASNPHKTEVVDITELCQAPEEDSQTMRTVKESEESEVGATSPFSEIHSKDPNSDGVEVVANQKLCEIFGEDSPVIKSTKQLKKSEVCVVSSLKDNCLKETKTDEIVVVSNQELRETPDEESPANVNKIQYEKYEICQTLALVECPSNDVQPISKVVINFAQAEKGLIPEVIKTSSTETISTNGALELCEEITVPKTIESKCITSKESRFGTYNNLPSEVKSIIQEDESNKTIELPVTDDLDKMLNTANQSLNDETNLNASPIAINHEVIALSQTHETTESDKKRVINPALLEIVKLNSYTEESFPSETIRTTEITDESVTNNDEKLEILKRHEVIEEIHTDKFKAESNEKDCEAELSIQPKSSDFEHKKHSQQSARFASTIMKAIDEHPILYAIDKSTGKNVTLEMAPISESHSKLTEVAIKTHQSVTVEESSESIDMIECITVDELACEQMIKEANETHNLEKFEVGVIPALMDINSKNTQSKKHHEVEVMAGRELTNTSEKEFPTIEIDNETEETEVCVIHALMNIHSKESESSNLQKTEDVYLETFETLEGKSPAPKSKNESEKSEVCVIPALIEIHSKETQLSNLHKIVDVASPKLCKSLDNNESEESEVCINPAIIEIFSKATNSDDITENSVTSKLENDKMENSEDANNIKQQFKAAQNKKDCEEYFTVTASLKIIANEDNQTESKTSECEEPHENSNHLLEILDDEDVSKTPPGTPCLDEVEDGADVHNETCTSTFLQNRIKSHSELKIPHYNAEIAFVADINDEIDLSADNNIVELYDSNDCYEEEVISQEQTDQMMMEDDTVIEYSGFNKKCYVRLEKMNINKILRKEKTKKFINSEGKSNDYDSDVDEGNLPPRKKPRIEKDNGWGEARTILEKYQLLLKAEQYTEIPILTIFDNIKQKKCLETYFAFNKIHYWFIYRFILNIRDKTRECRAITGFKNILSRSILVPLDVNEMTRIENIFNKIKHIEEGFKELQNYDKLKKFLKDWKNIRQYIFGRDFFEGKLLPKTCEFTLHWRRKLIDVENKIDQSNLVVDNSSTIPHIMPIVAEYVQPLEESVVPYKNDTKNEEMLLTSMPSNELLPLMTESDVIDACNGPNFKDKAPNVVGVFDEEDNRTLDEAASQMQSDNEDDVQALALAEKTQDQIKSIKNHSVSDIMNDLFAQVMPKSNVDNDSIPPGNLYKSNENENENENENLNSYQFDMGLDDLLIDFNCDIANSFDLKGIDGTQSDHKDEIDTSSQGHKGDPLISRGFYEFPNEVNFNKQPDEIFKTPLPKPTRYAPMSNPPSYLPQAAELAENSSSSSNLTSFFNQVEYNSFTETCPSVVSFSSNDLFCTNNSRSKNSDLTTINSNYFQTSIPDTLLNPQAVASVKTGNNPEIDFTHNNFSLPIVDTPTVVDVYVNEQYTIPKNEPIHNISPTPPNVEKPKLLKKVKARKVELKSVDSGATSTINTTPRSPVKSLTVKPAITMVGPTLYDKLKLGMGRSTKKNTSTPLLIQRKPTSPMPLSKNINPKGNIPSKLSPPSVTSNLSVKTSKPTTTVLISVPCRNTKKYNSKLDKICVTNNMPDLTSDDSPNISPVRCEPIVKNHTHTMLFPGSISDINRKRSSTVEISNKAKRPKETPTTDDLFDRLKNSTPFNNLIPPEVKKTFLPSPSVTPKQNPSHSDFEMEIDKLVIPNKKNKSNQKLLTPTTEPKSIDITKPFISTIQKKHLLATKIVEKTPHITPFELKNINDSEVLEHLRNQKKSGKGVRHHYLPN